jgi:hypothetical protein
MGSKSILECKIVSENADAVQQPQPDNPNPDAAESMAETRTVQQPQPDNPNPNAAESMAETRTVQHGYILLQSNKVFALHIHALFVCVGHVSSWAVIPQAYVAEFRVSGRVYVPGSYPTGLYGRVQG